jgi:hypothetical protein
VDLHLVMIILVKKDIVCSSITTGNSPSRGNNNEVATSSALPPYLGDLNVDGSPKLVETNSHSPLEQTIYDERQHRNTMTNNALVQFQKYSQVTHEPDTPPPPPVSSAAGQQVSGMAVPQAPQGDSGNVSIGLSPQRHHFGYSNFGQVPQSSDDWSVFSSAAGGDPPMPKYTTLRKLLSLSFNPPPIFHINLLCRELTTTPNPIVCR